MIEFQNDRVRLAAIHARMSDEVIEQLLATRFAVAFPLRGCALQIRRTVASVVFA